MAYQKKLLNTKEAAQILSVPPATVRALIRKGYLDAYKKGGRWFISLESAQQFASRGGFVDTESRVSIDEATSNWVPIDNAFLFDHKFFLPVSTAKELIWLNQLKAKLFFIAALSSFGWFILLILPSSSLTEILSNLLVALLIISASSALAVIFVEARLKYRSFSDPDWLSNRS